MNVSFMFPPLLVLLNRSSYCKITSCDIPISEFDIKCNPISWNGVTVGHLSGCRDPLCALFPFLHGIRS